MAPSLYSCDAYPPTRTTPLPEPSRPSFRVLRSLAFLLQYPFLCWLFSHTPFFLPPSPGKRRRGENDEEQEGKEKEEKEVEYKEREEGERDDDEGGRGGGKIKRRRDREKTRSYESRRLCPGSVVLGMSLFLSLSLCLRLCLCVPKTWREGTEQNRGGRKGESQGGNNKGRLPYPFSLFSLFGRRGKIRRGIKPSGVTRFRDTPYHGINKCQISDPQCKYKS